MSDHWLNTHLDQVLVVRSRKSMHWALSEAAQRAVRGQRYTDLDIEGPNRRVNRLVAQIEAATRTYNGVALRSTAQPRRITLQFPPSRSAPPPPPRAGVREPRGPRPDAPAGSAFIDE